MLRNQKIAKMPLLVNSIQALIQDTISADMLTQSNYHLKQTALMQFLAAALQVMPEESCCDTATKVLRLIEGSSIDQVKTQAYLTLEVLYASRRLSAFGDHITILLKNMLNTPEMPESFAHNAQLQGNVD